MQNVHVHAPANLAEAESIYAEAHAAADVERAKVAAAKQALTDAEQLAIDAAAALKTKPTAKTATDRLVADQLLENARESHQTAIVASREALAAEVVARNYLTYAKGMIEIATYKVDASEDVYAIIEAEARLRDLIDRAVTRRRNMLATTRDLTQIADQLSLPLPSVRCSIDELQREVHTELQKRYAQQLTDRTLTAVANWITVAL